jgi:hypothetical protein
MTETLSDAEAIELLESEIETLKMFDDDLIRIQEAFEVDRADNSKRIVVRYKDCWFNPHYLEDVVRGRLNQFEFHFHIDLIDGEWRPKEGHQEFLDCGGVGLETLDDKARILVGDEVAEIFCDDVVALESLLSSCPDRDVKLCDRILTKVTANREG